MGVHLYRRSLIGETTKGFKTNLMDDPDFGLDMRDCENHENIRNKRNRTQRD